MALYAGWTMDDDAATTAVVETNGTYDATFSDAGGDPNTDAHAYSSGGRFGLIFDGNDDYAAAGDVTNFKWMHADSSKSTVTFWYKPDTVSVASESIIATSKLTSSSLGYALNFGASRSIKLYIYNGNAGLPVIEGTLNNVRPNNTEWAFVAVTWDHTLATKNAKIYVNTGLQGSLNKEANAASAANSSYNMTFGIEADKSGKGFAGVLFDVRIYNTVLTQQEISDLYQEIDKTPTSGTYRVGTGSVGTRFLNKDWPVEEGLQAGTTKQTKDPYIRVQP